MKTKIIILSTFAVLGVLVSGQAVYAASPALSVLPAVATKTAGTSFDISLNIDPQGNQVCAVKGTLNLSNLDCKGITVASGLMAETVPTCSKPNFIFGIPKCTTSAKNILSVSVNGIGAGQAKALLNNVKVMGAGNVIVSSANGGTYNIIAVSAPASATDQKIQQPQVVQPAATVSPSQQASVPTASPFKTIAISVVILLVIAVVAGICYAVSKRKKSDKS